MSDEGNAGVDPYEGSRVSKGASKGKGLKVLEKAVTNSFGVFSKKGDDDD